MGIVIWMGTDWTCSFLFFCFSDVGNPIFTVSFQGQKLRKRLGSLIAVIDLHECTMSNEHFPPVRP